MEAANQNIATLQAELVDLQALEKEHLSLREKYLKYTAPPKLEKTEEEKSADSDADAKRQVARMQEKRAKVLEFLALLDKNLDDVRSRRPSLEAQIAALKARKNEYEKLIAELTKKKTALQKLSTNQIPKN